MPVYEFPCQQCGTLFEQWVASFNAIGEIRCPQCGSSDLKRKFSIFAARTGGSSRLDLDCCVDDHHAHPRSECRSHQGSAVRPRVRRIPACGGSEAR
jgi:putative FmdB family regulatory protein